MLSRRTTRLVAALSFAACVVIGLPGAVLGHAELSTVTPADTSTVGGSPPEIVMTFTEDLDPGRSSIRLVDSAGTLVVEGGAVDPNSMTMRLAVPANLAPGTYTIRWTSFSTEDNEQDRGTTTFTLTPSTAPPTAQPSNRPIEAPSASAPPASVVPSEAPSPSAPPTTPTASASDALIPIIVVVVAIIGIGVWLARGRARRGA
ncbi:MAG: copper resistance protein CopC [Chloroflexota bacterium]|nr:copper resistance protein CopC [Chloroflexota bacterium]